MHLTYRKTCRVCASTALSKVIDLGEQYLQGSFCKPGTKAPPMRRIPTMLYRCDPTQDEKACGLLQMPHTVPPSILYASYWYRSGTNQTMRDHLKGIADAVTAMVKKPKAMVLDIGCNDGTLLKAYDAGFERIGVDPSDATDVIEPPIRVVRSVFPSEEVASLMKGRAFDAITSIAMFYDLEDPVGFVREIKRSLAPDGLWVFEMSYMPSMLRMNSYDTVCLPPDGLVLTEAGLRPICDIKVGERVLTHKGRYSSVAETMQRDFDGHLVKLRAYGMGYDTLLTDNHPVLVKRGGRVAWIAAGEVVKGDRVARPIVQSAGSVDLVAMKCGLGRWGYAYKAFAMADDLMTVAGYYLAEGFVSVPKHSGSVTVNFSFGKHEPDLVEDCRKRLDAVGFPARVWESHTTTVVTAHGGIARWLMDTFGRGSAKKRVPAWVLRMPAEQLRPLYLAYMAGDGYRYRTSYQRGTTVSGELALGMSMLANRLGYRASISRQARPALAVIGGRTVHQQPSWDILVHESPVKKTKCDIADGYQWGYVRSVERVPYKGPVHNISVCDDHSYVTPGMTVHNCHEHLEYYSLAVIENILGRADMKIVGAELNDINGGSIRCYATHANNFKFRDPRLDATLEQLRAEEFDMELDTDKPYRNFQERIEAHRKELSSLLQDFKRQGKKIHVYGASTKGNTILQWCGLDHTVIDCAADRNPDKHGAHTLGTNIPIVSEEESRAMNPDYYLVLPWHFKQEFLKREKDTLARGIGMIFPLPTIEVVRQS